MSDTTSLAALDGRQLLVLASTHSYGCNGWEHEDRDEQDRSTIVLPIAATDRLEELVATWDTLWVRHPLGGDQTAAREIVADLGGVWPVLDTSPAPVWDETWKGTLAQFLTARDAHRDRDLDYESQVNKVLAWARLETFRTAGAILSDAAIAGTRTLVHDFGCRCAHPPFESDSDGRVVLRVRGDLVYACPIGMDGANLDQLVAGATGKAQDAYDKSNAKTPAVVDPSRYLDLRTPHTASSEDQDLTYAQWVQSRHDRAKQVADAVMAADNDTLKRLGAYVAVHDPEAARRSSLNSSLRGAGVGVLEPEDAADLLARLPQDG